MFYALYVRMQQHFVLPVGVIGFFQRIPVVLRFAHFLILLPAKVGIGGGQLGEKLKQAVRIDAVTPLVDLHTVAAFERLHELFADRLDVLINVFLALQTLD